MKHWLRPSLNWLLIFLPTAIGLHFFASHLKTWIFLASALAIIPLAGWMGRATEHLAEKTGEGIGGLLNATFGNAAELIIGLMALKEGKIAIVKASLTGSIIGNILLVLGAAFFLGGLKFKQQKFNVTGARSQSTLLLLAAIALICPAAYHALAGTEASRGDPTLGLAISVILFLTYIAGLIFSLRTHRHFFAGTSGEAEVLEEQVTERQKIWSLRRSILTLVGATALVAWVSEFLVASVEEASHVLGMSEVFVGVVVVAIIGNAAEHSTAVLVALKNRMELTLSIAVGSSIQVALFVAPILVFASYVIGPHPMDLAFSSVEVLAVFLSVWVVSQIADDGESNWLEGLQLLSVYLILALLFYFLPAAAALGH